MAEVIDKPVRKSTRKRKTTTQAGKNAAAKTTAKARGRARKKAAVMNVTPEIRRQMIAEAAYFRAEARGFQPGHELEDWLAAEAEVDLRLSGGAQH